MTKLLYAFSVITLMCIIAQNAAAVDVRGFPTCAAWLKQRKVGDFPALTNESWLLGYLSGKASGLDKDFLKGVDNQTMYHWVDNYCRAYPMKDVDDAARELAKELIEQKGL